MDYIREILNASSRIMDAVNDAVDRGDYSDLAKNITREMAGYTRSAAGDVKDRINKNTSRYNSYNSGSYKKSSYNQSSYNRGPRVYNYNVNRGPRNASAYGYRPIDIDLGTRQRNQGSQSSGNGGFWGGAQASDGQARNQSGYDAGQSGTYRQQGQGQSYSGYGRPGYSGTQGQGAARPNYSGNQGQGAARPNYSGSQGQAATRPSAQNQTPNSATNSRVTPFNQYKKNAGSGLLKQTAGVTGLFLTVPVVIANVAAAAATGGLSTIVTAAMFGAGAGVSGYFTKKGARQRKLSKIFDKYSKIVGNAEYMTIEDLAEMAGEPTDLVQKNLDEMIELGMLPQLKYDQKKTTMMLTKNAYDQYLLAENSRQEREKEEAALDAQAGSADARKVIAEGEAFVAKIKKANDLIPGEEMTGKLDQMERIVSKIFAQVRKDPASAADLRKFMNYYLPTTEKLLDAYVDLDKQPEIGENIPKTKREIEATVDTINDAFENLLDSLFEDVAWDISSDISVMKTMMEQDGLMKKGINDAKVTAAADVVSEAPSGLESDMSIPDIKEAVDMTTEKAADAASSTAEQAADAASSTVGHADTASSTAEQAAGYEPELKFDE